MTTRTTDLTPVAEVEQDRAAMATRARLTALVAVAALAGGCATRGLGSAPRTEPGAGTWVLVGLAALLAAAVLGVLLVRPDQRRPGSATFASVLLALHAGGVVVGTAVLVGLAVRSGQLAERPPDAELAVSLVQVGRIDGDGSLFALLVLLLVAVGGLVALLLTLAGRFSTGDDPIERWVAVGLLGLELLVATFAVGLVALGERSVAGLVVAGQAPLLAVALVGSWRRADALAPDPAA
jgi:hypothetical protein